MSDVDTPERLPWVATCLMLVAGGIGWVSLVLPEVAMFGLIALLVALLVTLLTTLAGTSEQKAALYFRVAVAFAGMGSIVPLTMIHDPATARLAFGLVITAYLVLLSSFSPWGTSPVFLVLVAIASAGATAVTFLLPPYPVWRGAVALKTLLFALPLGLMLGLLTGLVRRRRA